MVAGWVVIGEIICDIMFSHDPINHKFTLSDPVYDPIKYHVDVSWTSLADVVIDKSISFHAACHCWGGRLFMAHICERYAHFLRLYGN